MLSLNEINESMKGLETWSLELDKISKIFTLSTFRDAISFVNKISEISEKLNHHPEIIINYNVVKITLTTHYEKGLSNKDFETAKEIDKI